MSRAPAQRPLTLTEELEKLEQSITLTLQEIDHNFSQAHRIVTTSILPLVEQYAENSRDVWEGAKFWKQFFEASANVSLSGYEEKPDGEGETEAEAEADTVHETTEDNDLNPDDNPDETNADADETEKDFEMSALEVSSTPRARPNPNTEAADPETSDYEALKKELEAEAPFDMDVDTAAADDAEIETTGIERTLPITPQKGYASSPFIPPASVAQSAARQQQQSTTKPKYGSKPSDPIMHRMQDKTYRVQATPLGRSKYTITPKPASSFTPKPNTSTRDDDDDSSPEPEAPKLHEEIFSSPIKGVSDTPATTRKRRYNGTPISRTPASASRPGRTPGSGPGRTPGSGPASRTGSRPGLLRTPQPGTSVLTPAKGKGKSALDDFDDSFDIDLDDTDSFSPPKTMQFHIPQSRLMKTPAKEASKKIVEDLLVSAGAGPDVTDSIEGSPSLIRRAEGLEDESF